MAVKNKECESHRNDVKTDFEKKEEWFIENLTEEFRRDTPEETLKTIDTINQTSRNVNFVRQNRLERYDNDRTQPQYQRTTTNFKSGRGNSFQKDPENNNSNNKPMKNKINLKTSRNNSDARQNLKITFRNTHYTNAESTSQNSQQKNMGQRNTHNTNQQSTEQQRSSLKRDQE